MPLPAHLNLTMPSGNQVWIDREKASEPALLTIQAVAAVPTEVQIDNSEELKRLIALLERVVE